jgi:nucleoside diphosphate kinase
MSTTWFMNEFLDAPPGYYTFGLIKPDAYSVKDQILKIINYNFKLETPILLTSRLTPRDVKALYYKHFAASYYQRNEDHLTKSASLLMVIEGSDAVNRFRNEVMPVIRNLRSLDPEAPHLNLIHGSDSIENAFRELQYFI